MSSGGKALIYHKIFVNNTSIRAKVDNGVVFLSLKDLCHLTHQNYKNISRTKMIKENKVKKPYLNNHRINEMVFLDMFNAYSWIKHSNITKKDVILEKILESTYQLKLNA